GPPTLPCLVSEPRDEIDVDTVDPGGSQSRHFPFNHFRRMLAAGPRGDQRIERLNSEAYPVDAGRGPSADAVCVGIARRRFDGGLSPNCRRQMRSDGCELRWVQKTRRSSAEVER